MNHTVLLNHELWVTLMRQRHQISESVDRQTSLEPAMQYTDILRGRTKLRLSWWFLCCFEDALWVAGVLVIMIASQHEGLFLSDFLETLPLHRIPASDWPFPAPALCFSSEGHHKVSSDTCQHTLTAVRQSVSRSKSSVGDSNVLTLVAAGQKKKALTTAWTTWMTLQLPIAIVLFIIGKTKWHW